MASTNGKPLLLLHNFRFIRRKRFNHGFALLYSLAIFSLFYHHIQKLILSKNYYSFSNILIIADFILAFMWFTTQSFRMNPIIRQVYPENLQKVLEKKDFPALDIFICTADPFKEPPLSVVNTALSVMAYDYPTEKISVYVSDDGGSNLTLFAFMEAANFAKHWLPFCRRNNIIDRSPDVYFRSKFPAVTSGHDQIKTMYEGMKTRIEKVLEKGKVTDEYLTAHEQYHQVFNKWTHEFTTQEHPSVIQVLLQVDNCKDIAGNSMPNLVYVSREKSKSYPHHFKAGALNVLLRVSATMTNAPMILTLDCDMFSNDPLTPQRALCFLVKDSARPRLAYIQFPQLFHGLNETDIYGCEIKRLFTVNPMGMDGLKGPNYVGSGCFFRRQVFFTNPSSSSSSSSSSLLENQIPELNPDHIVKKPINSKEILDLAHNVSSCNYEDLTDWGSKFGFRYGSLVEDYYTGYHLKCEGWESLFCNPQRPAFLGDIPTCLNDVLSQCKRWSVGLLEVGFSKYCPLTFGFKAMGTLMALSYAHYAYWPIWFIPITIYAFLPQLTLINRTPIFPKVGDPVFFLYVFLFLGSYGQDCLDFVLTQGTFRRWWSDQRMWIMRGLSSSLFGITEYMFKHLGISTQGFNVTSKVVDDEQSKRYDQGKFEFGSPSPMFVPLVMASIINLIAFVVGFVEILNGGKWDELFLQIFIAGFGVLNALPFYEAMFLRADKGKLPTKTTIISAVLALGLYLATSFLIKI